MVNEQVNILIVDDEARNLDALEVMLESSGCTLVRAQSADEALLAKWARIREVRDVANKEIEALRTAGQVGSSLQATLSITANAADHALLATLGDDLKFVTITSLARLLEGSELAVSVAASTAHKCERCWHYRDDVGTDAGRPTLCGRCTSNLFGAGESRKAA